jgi:hypothetical protein
MRSAVDATVHDLTDAQIANMSDQDLDAWYDAQSIGPWEPVEEPPDPLPRVMTSITLRMPRDLLSELKAEATKHRQPYQRYLRDLVRLALAQAQAAGRPQTPIQITLSDDQMRDLTERREITVRMRRAGR